MSTKTFIPASDKQVSFAAKLLAQRDITGINPKYITFSGSMTKTQASDAINLLLGLPYKGAAKAPQVTEGFYVVDDLVYRVQKSKSSDRLYAKLLKVTVFGKATWEYAPGGIFKLANAEKLTLDTAKTMGMFYGVCMVCGRTLTNEESVSAGIGPICAGKL
jgi:hypothetical protein